MTEEQLREFIKNNLYISLEGDSRDGTITVRLMLAAKEYGEPIEVSRDYIYVPSRPEHDDD